MNKLFIIDITVLVIGLIICFTGIILTNYNNHGIEQCAICKERFNVSNNLGPNGFASGDSYYCVWTKDKTSEEIADTDTHEKCHILIATYKEHFCG